MISSEIIQALKERKLDLDCVEMVLRQNKEPDSIAFAGKGYIRQTSDDAITFKLYADRTENTTMIASLDTLNRVRSGTLYEKSDYYTLQAKSIDGAVWITESILPEHHWNIDNPNPILTGKLSSVYSVTQVTKPKHSLYLRFFDEANVPTTLVSELSTDYGTKRTRNRSEFRVGDMEFIVRKLEDGTFSLSVSSPSPLYEHLDMRIEEALRFALGQSVSWRVMVRNHGTEHRTEITTGAGELSKPKLPSPVSASSLDYLASCWILFGKYLEYVIAHTPYPFWNDVSYHLDNARQVSSGSYDSWAIGIGVAVEGLVNLIPLKRTRGEKEELSRLEMFVRHTSLDSDNYQHFADRLGGAITNMKQVSARDRMQILIESGHVSDIHAKAWTKVRNTHVHPRRRNLMQMQPEDYQELVDRIYKVIVLMYQIIFYLIGYVGRYTDYSTRDWPEKDYPASLTLPLVVEAREMPK
jgi:hypothetical protein